MAYIHLMSADGSLLSTVFSTASSKTVWPF